MDHCFKLSELTGIEMRYLKRQLAFFVRHGVKITFLRRVIYIHLGDHQNYCAIFNILHAFIGSGRLHCNEASRKWMQKYM